MTPSELRDPTVWVGGLLMFLAIVAFVVFAGIVW
jgi:hypothetical protein